MLDYKECSGKSSFFKWLFVNHPNAIDRIGYRSASQLRSSVTNLGRKEIYIIDLTRVKGRDDKEEDLLSIIEDIKSGLVINPMYGSGKTLIMAPPHVIISSNYMLDYTLFSEDRLEIYEIEEKSLDLKEIDIKTIKKKKEEEKQTE